MRLRVKHGSLRHNGETFAEGDELDMAEADALKLKGLGVVEPVAPPAAPAEPPPAPAPEPAAEAAPPGPAEGAPAAPDASAEPGPQAEAPRPQKPKR